MSRTSAIASALAVVFAPQHTDWTRELPYRELHGS